MVFNIALLIKIGLLLAAGLIGYGSQFVFKKHDTIFEQAAERYIDKELGYDIDFSKEELPVTFKDIPEEESKA